MEAVFTVSLIIAGLVLAIAGLIGCILPIIPGPPLSYLSLIVLSFAKGWEPFGTSFLVLMGILTAMVFFLDYAIPALGAKKYGASKWGVWGSLVGMIVGLFVFPPFGLFIGGFAGAVVGELYAGKARNDALKAGLGVFVGNLFSIGLKMGLCGVMLFFYIRALF